ncbi:MAG: RNA polymerase sigma-54 factor, partial [Ignavibacteriales bacterium]
MLTLNQRLSQQQKLSPQQIQYQKLLQLNTLALEQRIKTELELNPILEEVAEEELVQDEKKDDDEVDEFEDYDKEEFDLEDFMNDADFDSGDKVNRSSDDEIYHPVAPARESISEHLTKQLTVLDLSENLFSLGEEIIGNLDDDGYLKRTLKDIVDELSMFAHIDISMDDAEKLLKRIQIFDPVGIASRNLRECLLVQLNHSNFDP